MNHSFKPGQVWMDTEGKRIHAHGGSMLYENGYYYWYGENKEFSRPDRSIWHYGVRCYRSKDLYNWEDLGLIIPPEPEDESSPLHPSTYLDRPHIIYNQKTKKYVCWIKIGSSGGGMTILTADHLLGPYTRIKEGFRPLGMNGGDFDLAVAYDKKAYYFFDRPHREMICADLNEDYTDVTGYYSTHFPHPYPPYVREAPAYFTRGNKHYLLTSGTTGYYPNPSEIAVADTWHGPYTVLGDPHKGDPSHTSFHSQISCVFKVQGKKDLYIAMADRWLPAANSLCYEDYVAAFESFFNPDYPDKTAGEAFKKIAVTEDTAKADYVWLPLRFDGEHPYIVWQDEWSLDDFA